MNKASRNFAFIIAVVLVYIGFRFVTQAGQMGGLMQNDGYAGTGGIMILAGGVMLGLLIDIKGRGSK